MNWKLGSLVKMVRPFNEEEILQVLKNMDGDNELGPNDFTIAVFHKCSRW